MFIIILIIFDLSFNLDLYKITESCLAMPVDAHEKVGEETFVETQLPALLHVGKTEEDNQDNNQYERLGRIIEIIRMISS